MPDLKDMTALDFLRDERKRDLSGKSLGPLGLLTFVAAGITDLDVIYGAPPSAYKQVGDLVEAVGTVEPPLTKDDLAVIGVVGAKVYAQDRDNVADWLGVAQRWDEVRDEFRSYHVSNRAPCDLIAPFLEAGRGPSYVRRVVDSAARNGIDPHAYGSDLSADDWDRLATAGVADRSALAGYEAAGCSMTEAVTLAAAGVAPGVAYLLRRSGVPMSSWVDQGAGIPADWVPYGVDRDGFHDDEKRARDPIKDGVMGRDPSHTLADLKRYADAGWTTRLYNFGTNGLRFGHGRRSGGSITLSAKVCARLLDAGLTPDDLVRWANAVTTASAGSRDDRDYVPALLGYGWNDDMIADVARLNDAGVRPSHINDYRYAGCRSADDVLKCVAAGINGTRVAYLRKTHGPKTRRNTWDKNRMTLRELLHHHETDQQRQENVS